ncbi:MAG: KTSC domain-containing protein [Sphingomonadales bacterium]|nr:MAG: KTSC domain-containing protein [Sphingomonadales bacterium]
MPSSVIRRWDYDETARRLDLLFVSGKRYSYYEVPPEVAAAMRVAASKGSYFNENIRDHFAFSRRGATNIDDIAAE